MTAFRAFRGLAAATVVVVALAPGAHAGPIEATDGRDDDVAVDVARVWHKVTDDEIRFGFDTHKGFDTLKDFYLVEWDIDANGDKTPGDACILLESVGDGRLRAALFADCGSETWATAEASKSGSGSVSFGFRLREFSSAAEIQDWSNLGYAVAAKDLSGGVDVAPNGGLLTSEGVVASELTGDQRRQNALDGETPDGQRAGNAGAASGSRGRPASADAQEDGFLAGGFADEDAASRLPWVIAAGAAIGVLTLFIFGRNRRSQGPDRILDSPEDPVHVPDTSHS